MADKNGGGFVSDKAREVARKAGVPEQHSPTNAGKASLKKPESAERKRLEIESPLRKTDGFVDRGGGGVW